MGEAKYEGHAVCVADYEEDYLFLLGDILKLKRRLRGMSDFVEDAGGQAVRSAVPNAFEYEGDFDPDLDGISDPDEDGFWKGIRDEYRESTGRKNLPVMRVKVTVEVEPLSDEEAGKVWEEHVRQLRSDRGPDLE